MSENGKVIQGLRDIKTYLECQALEASVAGNDLAREGFIESQGIIRDAIALLKEQEEQLSIKTANFNRLVAKVEVMPKIVRCKDCERNIGGRCDNLDLWVETDPEWFCADGRKKGATALQ